MSLDSEQITDDELASSISDDGRLSSDSVDAESEGVVEAGIPPQFDDSEDSGNLEEEPFSVDDFDAEMSLEDSVDSTVISDEKNNVPSPSLNLPVEPEAHAKEQPIQEVGNEALPNGEVAEFRKTLSALSRQLEVDRLTFLYQQLQAGGNELPSLDRIASDIKGDSPLHKLGDEDLYSKRPLSRLHGWIAGLSFGVGRRAKKFSR